MFLLERNIFSSLIPFVLRTGDTDFYIILTRQKKALLRKAEEHPPGL
jgi:hypothetical protein